MTAGDFLRDATDRLKRVGIPTARLDVLVLLEDSLGLDRATILAHPETEIGKLTGIALNNKVIQRANRLPLAYVRGKAWFYGREFVVTPRVLCPRPESESFIDLLKTLSLPDKATIADIGTGSGCLGITATLEIPNSLVQLCDIDPEALALAAQNARLFGLDLECRQRDLLDGLYSRQDVLLANLPYVPDTHQDVSQEVRHEPAAAVFGGPDGLHYYRRFWEQIGALPGRLKPQFVLIESLTPQHSILEDLAQTAHYTLAQRQGLVLLFSQSAPHPRQR